MAEHVAIASPHAPPAIGAYSPGVRVGDFIFISGQLPIDMTTRKLAGDDIASQTRQVIRNIESLLDVTGASLGNVVKTTIYLKNLEDFKAMNEVYGEEFVISPPARSTVEVSRLPYGSLIEMEAVAHHRRPATALEAPSL